MNLEHASKVELRVPTYAGHREGSMGWEATNASTRPNRRGNGDGTEGMASRVAWGVLSWVRSQIRNATSGGGPGQEEDWVVVLLKPGNSGGGKGPCFGCACKEDEER